MMSTSNLPNQGQRRRANLPRRLVPIVLSAAFLLVHVIAPWGLSLLATRYGWADGQPGFWNLLALLLVIPCLVITIRLIFVHYSASPDTFMEFQQSRNLITPGAYSFSRNPMYLAELGFWLGWALFYGSIPVLIGFLIMFAVFNFVMVPYEERDLEKRFGDSYRQYRQATPRWFGKMPS